MTDPGPGRREARIALGIAALAALRVFLFASAFPFFTNVDEHRHVDMVLKYARGYVPVPGQEAYEPEMPTYLATYGSPEYHRQREVARERGIPPPPWIERGRLERLIAYNERYLADQPNLEAHQSPVYYALAGSWLALGRGLGISGGALLYWARQLNAIFAFALVLAAYRFLRDVYPDAPATRLGVPLLLAVFPLDVLFYLTPDALSPVLVGLGFFGAARIARAPQRAAFCILTGLVAAAAVLSKYTNSALLPVLALATAVAVARRPEARRPRGEGGRLALLWAAAGVPVALALLRNRAVFGDLTATAFKVEHLGWGTRAFSEWWDHPIFSLSGMSHFLTELTPMFWRGEVVWNRVILAFGAVDAFYLTTTAILLPLAVLGLLGRRGPGRLAEILGLALVAAFAAVLAWLSTIFVFGERTNPTANEPFFVQGRLISGAIAPFVLVYVRGIEALASRLPSPRASRIAAWCGVGLVSAIALLSEVLLSLEVFASRYNWFRLLGE